MVGGDSLGHWFSHASLIQNNCMLPAIANADIALSVSDNQFPISEHLQVICVTK